MNSTGRPESPITRLSIFSSAVPTSTWSEEATPGEAMRLFEARYPLATANEILAIWDKARAAKHSSRAAE
ncbi:MAG: hypothetical protein ACRD4E_02110 [Bryobacteraceae bacterium]